VDGRAEMEITIPGHAKGVNGNNIDVK